MTTKTKKAASGKTMKLNVDASGLRDIIIETVEAVLNQRERLRSELSDRGRLP